MRHASHRPEKPPFLSEKEIRKGRKEKRSSDSLLGECIIELVGGCEDIAFFFEKGEERKTRKNDISRRVPQIHEADHLRKREKDTSSMDDPPLTSNLTSDW